LYHIGAISPHKNTARCIEAFLESGLNSFDLVVSGMGRDSSLAEKYGNERIVFTGWIGDEVMASYYRHAAAVVFPSLQEGYGLPIVEAFGFGVPVITSNLDPMREIAGDAALLVDPYSIEDISAAMRRLTSKDNLRQLLIEKGQQRCTEISSKMMAQYMYDVYKSSGSK
jgi:glycosyltransferase involved in cell wall biosynthesis